MAKTLEETREQVLAGGKKFKRPVQYEKHRILINSAILTTLLVLVLGGLLYLSLYHLNSSNDVVYNITRLLPLNVAKVDGAPVRFADYLAQYRSSELVISLQEGVPGGEEGVEMRNYLRRASLDNAEMNAYAVQRAGDLGLFVTREQEEAMLLEHRRGGTVSEEGFARLVRENYGLSMSEYRRLFVHLSP